MEAFKNDQTDELIESMDNSNKILLTTPTNPYTVLNVSWDADSKAIQSAFRHFFRKDPRHNNKPGKNAQRKLTDLKERMKIDALCVEVNAPEVSLSKLKAQLEIKSKEISCPPCNDPSIFSDIFFPENLKSDNPPELDFGELKYRDGSYA